MKSILEQLNTSINGKNRFIASTVPFNEPLTAYKKYTHEIVFISQKQMLNLSQELIDRLLPSISLKRSEALDDLTQQMLKIFSLKEVGFGDKNFITRTITNNRNLLHEQFIKKEKLTFTLLGYPCKMPNPLYTKSSGVDLAEILSLQKLYKIMSYIEKIYPYGVELIILTEQSLFADMSGVSIEERNRYFAELQVWEKLIDEKNLITITDLVSFHTPSLLKKWEELKTHMIKHYNKKPDKERVKAVLPTNFMTNNYRNYDDGFLLEFFDPKVYNPYMEKLRKQFLEKSLSDTFFYLSYHDARKETKFMEKTFPNSIKFTVAPKEGSIGIQLLNNNAKLLPYYGNILVKGNTFEIIYNIDISDKAIAFYLNSNMEYPYFYRLGLE